MRRLGFNFAAILEYQIGSMSRAAASLGDAHTAMPGRRAIAVRHASACRLGTTAPPERARTEMSRSITLEATPAQRRAAIDYRKMGE